MTKKEFKVGDTVWTFYKGKAVEAEISIKETTVREYKVGQKSTTIRYTLQQEEVDHYTYSFSVDGEVFTTRKELIASL